MTTTTTTEGHEIARAHPLQWDGGHVLLGEVEVGIYELRGVGWRGGGPETVDEVHVGPADLSVTRPVNMLFA